MKLRKIFFSLLICFSTLPALSHAQVRSLTPPNPIVETPVISTPSPSAPLMDKQTNLALPPEESEVSIPQKTVASTSELKIETAVKPKIEDQPLSQITNQEIFNNFKKSVTPVVINESSEPIKIEYDIPRKSFKTGLDGVSKDLKFKLTEKSEKEDFSNLVNQGYNASLSGQLEAAIVIYKNALKQEEGNTNVLFALASLYHKLMQYPEARMYYKKLLSVDPNYKKAINNYLALVSEETPTIALKELKDIEAVNPEYTPVIAQIGMVYARLGDTTKAESYLKKSVSMAPEVASYRYNLAVVYDQMNKFTEAMTLYRQIMNSGYSYEILPQSRSAIKERIDYLQTKISIQSTENKPIIKEE